MPRRPAISSTIGIACQPLAPVTPVRSTLVRIFVVDAPTRRHLVVQGPSESRIVARAERPASPLELSIAAKDPVSALDMQRLRAIVESRVREVGHVISIDHEALTAEIGIGEEHGIGPASPAAAALATPPLAILRVDPRRSAYRGGIAHAVDSA